MTPCVFFDRDGIVNESPGPGYVERWADFRLLPEFVAALRKVTEKGYRSVIVTNQRGVARGVMTLAAVEEIHARLQEVLRERHGLGLAGIRVCPHEQGQCECRKPKPGMLVEAAREYGLDLARSWMVGDHETDVEAGRRAGCRTIRVSAEAAPTAADLWTPDMAGLLSLIDKHL